MKFNFKETMTFSWKEIVLDFMGNRFHFQKSNNRQKKVTAFIVKFIEISAKSKLFASSKLRFDFSQIQICKRAYL